MADQEKQNFIIMKIIRFLFSGTLMGILLVVFAVSIGYATFIENDFDATTAKMLIYNAKWFEILMLLMIINFTGMIFTRKLYRKSKLNILLIHIALIIILIGAAITRYIGFEGMMHIREGQTTNIFRSSDSYVDVTIKNGEDETTVSKKVWLTPVREPVFHENITIGDRSFDITLKRYMPGAVAKIEPDPDGKPIISIVTADRRGRVDTFLEYGQTVSRSGYKLSFGDTTDADAIQFIMRDGKLWLRSPVDAQKANMMTGHAADSTISKEQFSQVAPMKLIQFPGTNMMIKEIVPAGKLTWIPVHDSKQEGTRMARFVVKSGDKELEAFVKWGVPEKLTLNGAEVTVSYGNKTLELPFALKLVDFQLERYPGSTSPSSFASEVVLIDKEKGIEKPYRIFMNNILEYGGYRFYQSSYDRDERGTILSVNHDYWGTLITYIGYFLLFTTLLVSFFTKKTRFRNVLQQLKEVHEKRKKMVAATVVMLLALSVLPAQAQTGEVSKEHAEKFGKLLIQNKDGRISPLNTVSTQVLVKIYKKSKYKDLTADQVILGMIANPKSWQQKSIVKVGDPALQRMIGIEGKFAKFSDFFDKEGKYTLKKMVEEAYAKKPAQRNLFDKELIYVDERVNVMYLVFTGSMLTIFPVPDHPENKWVSLTEVFSHNHNHSQGDTALHVASNLFSNYMQKLGESIKTGDYGPADEALQKIHEYQLKEGASVIPPQTKIDLEIFYNKVNIFKNLFPLYMMAGVLLFAFFFIQVFKPEREFKLVTGILKGLLLLALLAHTGGLALRWYIAGHAPWSDGYESMIYIAWATVLAGFVFMKRAPVTLSVASLLAGVTLLTAHMSWMNPEITNLVPVLKSYWLTIHVATITASYGFLALGSLTGFLNLWIMIFRNEKNKERVNLTLKELTLIIELSLSVGLVLLVIGNFLGGIWANESWGRYWGWDPKETWSLVTIIVYTFILHMRLIPGLRNTFSFNFLAMFAFASVLMTYFGVNYYLSGLHSYASGDPVPVPTFVYYALAVMILISALAAYNDMKMSDNAVEAEAED